MKCLKFLFLLLFFAPVALAQKDISVAILDIQFDASHVELAGSFLGGSNFADHSSELIDWSYEGLCNAECLRFGLLNFKRRNKVATSEELAWLSDVENNSPEVKARFRQYLNFFHGTAVAGDAVAGTSKVGWYGYIVTSKEILEISYFNLPNVPPSTPRPSDSQISKLSQEVEDRWALPLENVRREIMDKKIRLVSMSWGIDADTMAFEFDRALRIRYKFAMEEAELKKISAALYENYFRRAEKMMADNPDTLFFATVPNQSVNVDQLRFFPTHAQVPNKLVTQASIGLTGHLAEFAAFGVKTVDLAAPGVDIFEPVPGNKYIKGSGCSISAPRAMNIAARVLEINPKLTALELKDLLIRTAKKFDFMIGKNANSAIIDPEAAFKAARESLGRGASL